MSAVKVDQRIQADAARGLDLVARRTLLGGPVEVTFPLRPGDRALVEHGGKCLRLRLRRKHRTSHQPLQIGTFRQHRGEPIEIGPHGVDRFFVARQFKQGRRVTT